MKNFRVSQTGVPRLSFFSALALTLFAIAQATSCAEPSSGGGRGGSGGSNQAGDSGNGGGNAGGNGGTSMANCPALAPTAGARPVPDVIISEIAPGQGIELYNTTDRAIDLAMARLYLCASFVYTQAIGSGNPPLTEKTSIPPRGYLKVSWPSEFETVASAMAGEMLLYRGSTVPTASNVMDYVCWGSFTGGRKTMAAGGMVLYPGDCTPAMASGSLHRKAGTNGEGPDSYDHEAAPDLADCP